jgi:hypothetical protein
MNGSIIRDPATMPLFRHLGKLTGIACRHNMLVALSLPRLIWRPLAAEILSNADMKAVSFNFTKSLVDTAAAMSYLLKSPEEKERFAQANPQLIEEISIMNSTTIESVKELIQQAFDEFSPLDGRLLDGSLLSLLEDSELSADTICRLCDLLLYLRMTEHQATMKSFEHIEDTL